jgi:hypothetical protein
MTTYYKIQVSLGRFRDRQTIIQALGSDLDIKDLTCAGGVVIIKAEKYVMNLFNLS